MLFDFEKQECYKIMINIGGLKKLPMVLSMSELNQLRVQFRAMIIYFPDDPLNVNHEKVVYSFCFSFSFRISPEYQK